MIQGKGIDRAFRTYASKNLVLRGANRLGLIRINPTNRGADMIGRGMLRGRWRDVTTSRAWGAHVNKYGPGGIPLLY